MNKAVEHWDPRTPMMGDDRDAILRELQAIVDSSYFCNSKRYPALLRYLVENVLAGRSELLKERTLGIEVFDRSPTYDTSADTVVRYTAGEVRKRLLVYYSKHTSVSGIRISLPPGSYVPEFIGESELQPNHTEISAPVIPAVSDSHDPLFEPVSENSVESQPSSLEITVASAPHDATAFAVMPIAGRTRRRTWALLGFCALLLIIGTAALAWRWHTPSPDRAVDDFWAPVLHDHQILVCTGGVVFQKNDYSGVITANKDNDYPFVSMQGASAIAQISALIEHAGATMKLVPSPTTPISDIHDHPVVLLGGYNNRWTMNLLQSVRFRFTFEPVESIIDQNHPQVHWARDRSRPYSGADDYALIARYRDGTTGDWVVVLAGLGRNGTEAAAQFVASPHSMKMLEDRTDGGVLSGKNVEAVLRVRVIEGKTGASSIEAVHVW